MCYKIIKHEADESGNVQYDIRLDEYDSKKEVDSGDDVCVGYCVFRKCKSDIWGKNSVHIDEVYINEDYRGDNLARELLKVVLADAYAENYTLVTINNDPKNFDTDEDVSKYLNIHSCSNIRYVLFGKQ